MSGSSPSPSIASEFGVFQLSEVDWLALSAAMQSEGARLAIERAGSIQGASLSTGLSPRVLATAFADNPDPHVLPRINEATWQPDDDPPSRRDCEPAFRADGRFLAFAQIHLAGKGKLHVPSAYATYQAFCAGCGCDPIPRSSFGAALLGMARGHGGSRVGDSIKGLSLRDGLVASVPPVPPSIKPDVRPPRAPLVLGIAGPPRGRRVIEITEDGERIERREEAL